ncbi:MAG: ATP-binding protein [Sulfolobales archaeon]|nr:ATP-binding protein [Sulfolobales archaeon]MDW8010553.1 ATP-binding protein [Sulfolobales archaeon]
MGRTSSTPKLPVYVEPGDFLRHCLIVGSTGSGKTRFATRLSRELKRYGAVVVLDWYGEYLDTADRVIHVGVSDPVAIPIEDPLDAVFLLEEVLDLSSPQSYLLAKVLKRSRDLEHVVDLVEAYEPEARWEVETRASLARKLSLLLKYGRVFKVVPPSDIGKVDVLRGDRLTVFNLSNLKTLELKRLVALGTLNAVKYVKERGILEDRVFVVVEEAHNVMARSKLLQRYLAEVRKLGIGLIVITQSPASLDYEVMNNTNIKIVKTLKSAEDIAAISRSMNLGTNTASTLSKLELNEALVEAPSLSEPIVVEVD